MFDRRLPILGPVSTLEATLLQTVKGFCVRNRLDIKKYEVLSDGRPRIEGEAGTMYFTVRPKERGTPQGYAINIHTKRGMIPIPAGGMTSFKHEAGRITEVTSILPSRTLNFTKIMVVAGRIEQDITALGYEVERRNIITEQEFHERFRLGQGLYARWHIKGEWIIEMRIKAFSSYSHVAFTTPIGSPPDVTQEPESYLLDFYMVVDDPISDEIYQLQLARRLALTGDKYGRMPVKIWFDDPDWRPPNWQGTWIK